MNDLKKKANLGHIFLFIDKGLLRIFLDDSFTLENYQSISKEFFLSFH